MQQVEPDIRVPLIYDSVRNSYVYRKSKEKHNKQVCWIIN